MRKYTNKYNSSQEDWENFYVIHKQNWYLQAIPFVTFFSPRYLLVGQRSYVLPDFLAALAYPPIIRYNHASQYIYRSYIWDFLLQF